MNNVENTKLRGLWRFLEHTGLTGPLAAEAVALAGCLWGNSFHTLSLVLGYTMMLYLSHSCACKKPQGFSKLDLGGIFSLLCLR